MSRSRNWNFTLNIDDEHLLWESDFEALCDFFDNDTHVRGAIFQEEIGGNTHRQHYQGFLRLKSPKTRNQLRELFTSYTGHTRTHLSKVNDPVAAIAYCKKPEGKLSRDTYWEFGDLDFQSGKRNDLLECREVISNPGWKHTELYEKHFGTSVRYMQGLEKASFYIQKAKQEERDVEVSWLWGKSGTGKSRLARRGLTISDYFRLPTPQGGRVWWDGYEGEKVLIIEEFFQFTMPIENLLELLDRYPLQLQVKGAFTWASWTKVIITSQFHFSTVYPFASQDQMEALRRRITHEKHFDSLEILERDPEDTHYFHLRHETIVNERSNTLSLRDPPIDLVSSDDSSPAIRGPAGKTKRRVLLDSMETDGEEAGDRVPSPPMEVSRNRIPCTPTQLVCQETLSESEEERPMGAQEVDWGRFSPQL